MSCLIVIFSWEKSKNLCGFCNLTIYFYRYNNLSGNILSTEKTEKSTCILNKTKWETLPAETLENMKSFFQKRSTSRGHRRKHDRLKRQTYDKEIEDKNNNRETIKHIVNGLVI